MSDEAVRRLDEIEAKLRASGMPDTDGWRRRVDAMNAIYERVKEEDPRHVRALRWLARRVGGLGDRT